MDDFKKHINDKINEDNASLPEFLTWDNMEDGIFNKMEEKKENKRRYPFFLLFFSAIICLALLVFFIQKSVNQESISSIDNAVVESINQSPVQQKSPVQEQTPVQEKSTTQEALSNQEILEKNYHDNTIDPKNKINNNLVNESDSKTNQKSNSKIFNTENYLVKENINQVAKLETEQIRIGHSVENISKDKTNNINTDVQSGSEQAANNAQKNILSKDIADWFIESPITSYPYLVENSENRSFGDFSLSIEKNDDNEETAVSYMNFLGASFAVNQFDWNAQSDFDISDLEKETGVIGLHATYGRYLHKNFYIKSGVNFQVYRSTLNNVFIDEHRAEADSTPIYNVITSTLRYEEGGEKIVTQYRKVVHYNRYYQISIPLELGIEIQKGKSSFGLTAGVAYTIFAKSGGRTSDHNEILIDYSSNNYLKSSGLVSGLSSVYYDYEIGNNLFLNAGLNAQLNFNNWTSNINDSRMPFQYGVQLGIKKHF